MIYLYIIIYNISIFRNQQKIFGIVVDELNELWSPKIRTAEGWSPGHACLQERTWRWPGKNPFDGYRLEFTGTDPESIGYMG